MKLRLLALAGATVIATLPLTTAQTASAATKCPKNYVCSWKKASFKGTKHIHNNSSGCSPFSGRSVSNQTGKLITVYTDESCYGDSIDIETGHYSSKTPWRFKSVAVWGQ
ncbi:peptidase inhibitor family I36 protein [Streptomyces europaeiscabiei]|uniref:peptidase inhibitor family I36 protein n=1 Tax=Streptomyces TaxID=1883 RepID=UPI000A39F066|nr:MULTISPECIES: peptidase inhibitor family I36 protein [Streptomyces]MDX3635860.1 peptidase inhibitor family I36 protein [Streptomyces europaeiscabiei]MDX3653294.1 peptidase inhibitor family I36 protein [Streptomyces europaeiscabiei]WUD33603.1 peptidase inhibitor family I36 protein [Streptomyces europaeiscabiei]